jgi:riboflavin biosynthesis pyrimidine reductase
MTTSQTDEHVRRVIRDAMDRLINGKALHSDGKLTVKSLAEEARVKRWVLTHRHTDLQDEFRVRIANTSVEPPAIRALQEEKAEAAKKVKALTADVTALTATIHQLERVIQVLALENHELRSVGGGQGKVVPLRTRGVPR